MHTSGVNPGLNAGMTGLRRRGMRGPVPVSKVEPSPTVSTRPFTPPIRGPKPRRQLTAAPPVIGPQGPPGLPNLGGPPPMGNLASLVGSALRPQPVPTLAGPTGQGRPWVGGKPWGKKGR